MKLLISLESWWIFRLVSFHFFLWIFFPVKWLQNMYKSEKNVIKRVESIIIQFYYFVLFCNNEQIGNRTLFTLKYTLTCCFFQATQSPQLTDSAIQKSFEYTFMIRRNGVTWQSFWLIRVKTRWFRSQFLENESLPFF